jgi:uncharacterized membrane protein
VRRRLFKSAVKDCRLTTELPLILNSLSMIEVAGMDSVAVKCIDIIQNSNSVGRLLSQY